MYYNKYNVFDDGEYVFGCDLKRELQDFLYAYQRNLLWDRRNEIQILVLTPEYELL